MVIADNLAPFVDRVYDNNFVTSFSDAWTSTLAFTFQIYMDFSGYSDIAIGLGLLMGFSIPENFNSPYSAVSFSEFWKRWHISLSRWLRDYLYIPLGGNRQSKFRTRVNLMITMLLGGLWHGAAWNFVVWGFMHGSYLVIERTFGLNIIKTNSLVEKVTRRSVVFLLVMFTWVMFRGNFTKAVDIFASMFVTNRVGSVDIISPLNEISIVFFSIVILFCQNYFAQGNFMLFFKNFRRKKLVYSLILSIMIYSIIFFKGEGGAFIYFQF
jgi:alginate O-acetyltransferase complex protein AlgI